MTYIELDQIYRHTSVGPRFGHISIDHMFKTEVSLIFHTKQARWPIVVTQASCNCVRGGGGGGGVISILSVYVYVIDFNISMVTFVSFVSL